MVGTIIWRGQHLLQTLLELLISRSTVALAKCSIQRIFQNHTADFALGSMQRIQMVEVRMLLAAALALVVFSHHFQHLDLSMTDFGSRVKITLDRVD